MFQRKAFLKIAQTIGKHLCWSLFLIKLQDPGMQICWLQHRCIPVNFAKILRTPSLQNTFRRVLLENFIFNSAMLLICYLIRWKFIHNRCIIFYPVSQKDCQRSFILGSKSCKTPLRSVKSIFSVALFHGDIIYLHGYFEALDKSLTPPNLASW